MTITIIDRAVGRRPLRVTALSLALACCPMLASAQTPQPLRAAQAQAQVQAPAKPKAAPQAAAQPAAAPAAVTQGTATQGSAPKLAGEDVVAKVGNTNVSAAELRSYVAALAPNERAALAQDPALFSQAVRMLLANRLVLQEISAKKWDQQPNVIAQLDRVRENAVVELYLQTASAPPANYPSDEDLQKVYDANRAALLMPRQFELAQIFVALPKDADKAAEDQAKKSLDDIQRKLKAPAADFAALANENNAKNTTGNGGDLGWLLETQIRPEIRTRVMELSKGAVTDPIRLDDGWHVIKLIDTKASYTRTLPEVRDQLAAQMRNERATALRRAYLAELLKEHPPVLNELALSNLLLEQTPAAR
jgi:parvulin-like peptidyl-prolyl isomerase